MKKGIIFDVDGTLWDSSEAVAESYMVYLKNLGLEKNVQVTGEDIRGVMGMTMDQIRDTLFTALPVSDRGRVVEGCFAYEVEYLKSHGGILYPDVRSTMEQLAGTYHLYVVSNCQSGYIEDFLSWAKVEDLIEDFTCFGDTGLGKSDNLRLIGKRNLLDRAVYLGDTAGDLKSAKEAGILFIHARYGFGRIEEEVPFIDSLCELPEAAAQVLKD